MNRSIALRVASILALFLVLNAGLIEHASAQVARGGLVGTPTPVPPPSTLDKWSSMDGHLTKSTNVYLFGEVGTTIADRQVIATPAEQKLEGNLLRLINQIALDGSFAANAAKTEKMGINAPAYIICRIDNADRLYVYIAPQKGHPLAELEAALRAKGVIIQIASQRANMLEAWVPVLIVKDVAALEATGPMMLITDPATNTGSVTSLGVSRLRSDVSTQVLGATGSGIKIGVMSDDCGSGPGGALATSKSTGDINSNFVSLSDFDSLVTHHEGLAMSEIVQDVAPSAQIYFATGEGGIFTFADHMAKLATAGCTVICDDLQYFSEPVFEDGYLATVVDSLAANGVVYVSSAGNQDGASFYGTYANMAGTGLLAGMNVCDFGSGNPYMSVSVLSGFTVTLVMQWDDPFGGSSNDYNFYLVNSTKTAIIASSTSVQNGSYPYPYESLSTVPGANATDYIVVERKTISGTDANATARLKLTGFPNAPVVAFGNSASSTFGHSSADSCISAGAIDATGSNYNTIESFSGQGPSYRISFGTGTRSIDLTRQKPDVACFDGVATTVSGFGSFYGTSASSPHIAGVAGLLMATVPGITAVQCRAALRSGTIDEGSAGTDYAFGYGRLDAFKAITQSLSGIGKSYATYKTVNTAIPDGSSSLSSSISPTLAANADSVYVSFTIDAHPKWGDLTVTLTGPDATVRTLLTRPPSSAGTSTGLHPNVLLGDQASTSLQSYNPGSAEVIGFYAPQNTISTASGFHNRGISGTWTLNVSDAVAGNSGTLKDWGIYWKVLPNANENLVLSAAPPYIWSSDNSLKTINVTQTVGNGAIPVVKLNSITANESVAGGDIVATTGTNTLTFQLRAQCNANIARVYTANYELTDIGGYDSVFSLKIPVLRQLGHASSAPVASGGGTSLALPSVNPVVTTTQISYTLPSTENVYVKILDLHGKWLRNLDRGLKSAGLNSVIWDGKSADGTLLPDATYIYQLDAGGLYRDGVVTLNH